MAHEIIHRELCYAVNGCIFDVHNALGPGLREETYQAAMQIQLGQKQLAFIAKPHTRRELIHRGVIADVFEPDLIVEDRLIVELKVQPGGLAAANFRQIMVYLKSWQLPLGLLANMAAVKAAIQRVLYREAVGAPEEDYRYVENLVTAERRETFDSVRDAVLAIHRQFGLGYNRSTYRALLEIECRHRGLPCQPSLVVHPLFEGRRLPHSPITPLAVGEMLVEVQAVESEITARAVKTMQSHLRLTGAPFGLVVNFGQQRLQLRGVRPHGQE